MRVKNRPTVTRGKNVIRFELGSCTCIWAPLHKSKQFGTCWNNCLINRKFILKEWTNKQKNQVTSSSNQFTYTTTHLTMLVTYSWVNYFTKCSVHRVYLYTELLWSIQHLNNYFSGKIQIQDKIATHFRNSISKMKHTNQILKNVI